MNNLKLTCRFIEGSEATMLELPEARVSIAPRFAYETERTAAANDVASIPAVIKECSAADIRGIESAQTQESNI